MQSRKSLDTSITHDCVRDATIARGAQHGLCRAVRATKPTGTIQSFKSSAHQDNLGQMSRVHEFDSEGADTHQRKRCHPG